LWLLFDPEVLLVQWYCSELRTWSRYIHEKPEFQSVNCISGWIVQTVGVFSQAADDIIVISGRFHGVASVEIKDRSKAKIRHRRRWKEKEINLFSSASIELLAKPVVSKL
jgi:hypothetical protein